MVFLYIGSTEIKLLGLSKAMFSQFNPSYFSKRHVNDLTEKGKIINIDIAASAIKEGLTMAQPKEINDREICLILPQESFSFFRYDIPADISERAISPFIRDKIRLTTGINLEESYFDYVIVSDKNKSEILVFVLEQTTFKKYQETLSLLGLSIKAIIPESLCYFKLFEKTIRADKMETILYVFYQQDKSYGFLYNSLGLLNKERYKFDSEIKISLKNKIAQLENDGVKLNRIVLSGSSSEQFRQDFFTKEVGVWTNPLKKIITNFYQNYLKMIIVDPQKGSSIPILDFDICFGAFIFLQENKSFSLLGKNSIKYKKNSFKLPRINFPSRLINKRDIFIFLLSFLASFSLIFFLPQLKSLLKNKKIPVQKESTLLSKPTTPTQKPSPTPAFVKSDLKIKILNGSGTSGKANEAKTLLQDKGYGEILTGNADSFDYENTQIQVKNEKNTITTNLISDLADSVDIDEKFISNLEEDNPADVVIIIGTDFK